MVASRMGHDGSFRSRRFIQPGKGVWSPPLNEGRMFLRQNGVNDRRRTTIARPDPKAARSISNGASRAPAKPATALCRFARRGRPRRQLADRGFEICRLLFQALRASQTHRAPLGRKAGLACVAFGSILTVGFGPVSGCTRRYPGCPVSGPMLASAFGAKQTENLRPVNDRPPPSCDLRKVRFSARPRRSCTLGKGDCGAVAKCRILSARTLSAKAETGFCDQRALECLRWSLSSRSG